MSQVPTPDTAGTVWAVDADHGFFDALTWMDQLRAQTERITSVTNFVEVCVKHSQTDSQALSYVAMFGHGTGGFQSIGSGRKLDATGSKSLRFRAALKGESNLFGNAEHELAKLNSVLADDATVLLAGCNVGEGGQGDGLLQVVSTILGGRTVCAFENQVFWWTGALFGSMKQANGDKISSSLSYLSLSGHID